MATATESRTSKTPLYFSLSFQMIVGLVIGAAVGLMWPDIGIKLNPLATGFVKLIRMVAGLIVFLTITTGFAQMGKNSKIGRIGVTAIVYFEIVSTLALCLGLLLGNYFQPGAGMTIPADSAAAVSQYASGGKALSLIDFILSIIPQTVVDALSSGVMLQILLIAILFGAALYQLGERAKPLVQDLTLLTELVFKIVGYILRIAPIGVFGAAAFVLAKFGIYSLVPLAKLVGLMYLGCILFCVVVFGTIARLAHFSLIKYLISIKEEIILAFMTTASEAALPGLMRKLEKAGCSKAVVGFVVPAGYSFNLDGSSFYLTLTALFIAQTGGVHLGWGEQISMLVVFLLTSKGVAGVSGGGFVTLAATLLMFPNIPLGGLALALGVDRFNDAARTTLNIIGNGVATMAISSWFGQLDPHASEADAAAAMHGEQRRAVPAP